MSIQRWSPAFVIACALTLIGIRLIEDESRYTFGQPHTMDVLIVALMVGLFLTHGMIAVIMWLQRERWLPSDAAMFRFIAIKSLLWINTATIYVAFGRGVRLDLIALYLMIAFTTADLDIRMCRRYIFRTMDEREPGDEDWSGEERRSGLPGRRAYDQFKGRA